MSLDTGKTLQDTYIQAYYAALACPRSLMCYLLWKHGEHKQLVNVEFDPHDYNCAESAQNSLAATKFLSKATFLDTGVNLRQVALDGFVKAESFCEETNDNIRRLRFKNPYTLSVLTNMQRIIGRVLGDFTPGDFVDACDWGPGASTLIKRRDATGPLKFDVERQITPSAYDFVKDWFHVAFPNWDFTMEIVSSSKIVTVPKNAKTDRVIAIEPGLNLWFQKGIGALIRRALKKCGIDLNDQRHNQRLARLGSLFSELATVDFSAASDTIAYELVKFLLPKKWFNVLNAFRTNFGQLDGTTISFEKFSSMGNGFTFELESLIFYALAEAVCYQCDVANPVISVYGDDVILPSSVIDIFTSISYDLGFSVNTKKSYSTSYFRESCGSYYWKGCDIKPIFQKEPLNGKTSVLKAANNIRRSAHRRNYYGCDRRLRRCWQLLAKSLGADAPKISDGYGDVGLVVNYDEAERCPSVTRAKHGYEGYYTRVWSLHALQRYFDTPGLHLYKLKAIGNRKDFDPYDIPEDIGGGNTVPMSGRYKFAKIRILVPLWQELGPWV